MIEIHIRHGQASPVTGQLTPEGERQAVIAVKFIRAEFPDPFHVGFHSPSSRAADTAKLLALPNITWEVESGLAEKQLGENWNQMIDRIKSVDHNINAMRPQSNRVLVYHGDAMHAMRAWREGFMGPRFDRLFEEPYKYFNNAQLIIYTDEAPQGRSVLAGSWWVKSVCPWAEGKFGHDWVEFDSSKSY